MDAPADLAPLPPGTRLHALVIRKTLGRGGVGIVYAAEHEILGETFAIKEFLPEQLARRVAGHRVAALPGKERIYEGLKRKFMEEGQTLVELAHPRPHPNLVQVTDAFYENDTVYLCMRFERGRPLDEVLKEHGPLSETEARELLLPLLDGLAHAHAHGVWHRDIKPSNILIREDGSPVLIDFGAAHRERPNGAVSIIAQYTPSFAAPEQLYDGVQGPWTDVYSLAATLYYAVTGQLPPPKLEKNWRAFCTGFSKPFMDAIESGLTFDPERRPKDAASWRELFLETPTIALAKPPLPPSGDQTEVLAPREREEMSTEVLAPKRRQAMDTGIQKEGQAPTAPRSPGPTPAPPLASEPPQIQRSTRPWIRWWALGGVLLALAISTGVWLYERLSHRPEGISGLPGNGLDKTLDLAALSKGLNLNALPCARVELRVYGAHTLGLSGYLRDAQQLADLLAELRVLHPTLTIESRALGFAAPFCELIDQLDQLAPPPTQYPGMPILGFNHPDRFYREDEYLVLNAVNPGVVGGYLYLDFVDSNQQIVHLFPNADQPDHYMPPGKQVRIGAQDAEECERTPDACFMISRPHGNNLILVIWSESPLLDRWRTSPAEPVEGYLSALKTLLYGLPNEAPHRRAIAYYFFTSSD